MCVWCVTKEKSSATAVQTQPNHLEGARIALGEVTFVKALPNLREDAAVMSNHETHALKCVCSLHFAWAEIASV